MRMSDPDAPDYMPRASAFDLPDGLLRFSSVGQLWEVRNRQWVRIKNPTADQIARADNPTHTP